MSCGSKAWVSLIGPTGYISYCPSLVTRQFGETQYVPRTKGLSGCIGSFKEVNSVAELEVIKSDWGQPVLVGRGPHPKESSFSPNYLAWRSYETPQNAVRQSLMRDKAPEVERAKGKKIDKEDAQEDLEKLRIEFNNSKSCQNFLEEQLLEERQMRFSLDQQLQEQINKSAQKKSLLEEMDSRYNDLTSKYEAIEKELVALKEASMSREHECQEAVASLKKERDHYKMKWETEKEKGRVASLVLEDEKELKAQYKVQAENELEARRVAKFDMKRYLTLTNSLRDRVSTLQAELETRGEELKIVQEQHSEWQE